MRSILFLTGRNFCAYLQMELLNMVWSKGDKRRPGLLSVLDCLLLHNAEASGKGEG